MIGGEKHINPHYNIKAESPSCYHSSEGFTGIEINGVRFSNIREMLIYMNKQRDQLIEAKDIIKDYMIVAKGGNITVCSVPEENRCINVLKLNKQAEQFLKDSEVKK